MMDCFISYRRTPSAPQALLLQEKLKNQHKIDAYVDVTRTDSTKVQFPERLMKAIEDAPVFVCLLGDRDGQHTLESEWVLREIVRAYELRKFCVPIFQESYTPLPNMPEAVNYLLSFDGVHIFDQKNVMMDESVAKIASLIRPHRYKQRRFPLNAIIAFAIISIISVAALALISSPKGELQTGANATTAVLSPIQAATVTQTRESEVISFQATVDAINTGTRTALQTMTAQATQIPSILISEQIALTSVTQNADWIPIEHDFSGITMVLVPAGCFEMGSEDGDADERPIYPQCFDEPFWIDKTEVKQADFERLGGQKSADYAFTGEDLPVESISWVEAHEFCMLRDARLPTEREWEYAARGPENYTFPWGNEFIDQNLIYTDNSNGHTGIVGSRDGASWIGAVDMSGNVREWVSSKNTSYPYGLDHEDNTNMTSTRVMRGGAFDDNQRNLRSASRIWARPDDLRAQIGFRCARDFE